jgi:hypothetical protein
METPKMSEFERIKEAYLMMAKAANYRPYAPGDGHGHIQLTEDELQDSDRVHAEAKAYASGFSREADAGFFHIGCLITKPTLPWSWQWRLPETVAPVGALSFRSWRRCCWRS